MNLFITQSSQIDYKPVYTCDLEWKTTKQQNDLSLKDIIDFNCLYY